MRTDRAPLTPQELDWAIRTYIDDECRRPTIEDLARRLGRPAREVRDAFGQLMKAGRATFESGLMTLLDRGVAVRPVTLPAAPVRIPPPAPHKPVLTKRPSTTRTPKEATDDMGGIPDRVKDQATVDEYEQVAKVSKAPIADLAKKYNLTDAGYAYRLKAARTRLRAAERGQKVYAADKQAQAVSTKGVGPACSKCGDSGIDRESGKWCTCPVGQQLFADAQERERHLEAEPTSSPGATAPACAQCQDRGTLERTEHYVKYCTCPIGQALEVEEQGGDDPPAPPASTAPAATAEPEQGVSTQSMAVPATSATAPQEGMLMDVPQAAIAMTVAPVITPTIPTADQLPAIVGDLNGHQSTASETDQAQQRLDRSAKVDSEKDAIIAAQLERIRELEHRLGENGKTFATLCMAHGKLETQYETAIADAHRPLMLLIDGDTIREVAGAPATDKLPKPGDRYAELVEVDGVQHVNVLLCKAAGVTATSNSVRVMVLVYSSATQGEAA